MLREDALRRHGDIDRAQTEERVRQFYDLWSHGDVDEIVAGMSADVQLATRGQWAGVKPPFEGRFAVAAHLRRFGATVENILSVLHEIVIDGDRAVVHRTAVGRRRDTGRRYQCDCIDFFRFRDGFIVEFSAYPDPAWFTGEPQI